jgi:hypothetical protein
MTKYAAKKWPQGYFDNLFYSETAFIHSESLSGIMDKTWMSLSTYDWCYMNKTRTHISYNTCRYPANWAPIRQRHGHVIPVRHDVGAGVWAKISFLFPAADCNSFRISCRATLPPQWILLFAIIHKEFPRFPSLHSLQNSLHGRRSLALSSTNDYYACRNLECTGNQFWNLHSNFRHYYDEGLPKFPLCDCQIEGTQIIREEIEIVATRRVDLSTAARKRLSPEGTCVVITEPHEPHQQLAHTLIWYYVLNR